jgi:hypothetical protein
MESVNHLIYLGISAAFTVLVGRSLYQHGKPFLIECWKDAATAEAVNKFFLVGFYLMNLAFIFAILRFGKTGLTIEDSLEVLSGRIGIVALVMGVMHFNNLFWCLLLRHRRAAIGSR